MDYTEISKNIDKVRSIFPEGTDTGLVVAASISFLAVEEKIYSASVCFRKIDQLRRFSTFNLHFQLKHLFSSKRYRTQRSYEYFFFVCCRKIYDELEKFEKFGVFAAEISVCLDKLRHLKDQRDGMEHGNEDMWKILARCKGRKQSPEELARKALKRENFDFKQNMQILDEIYFDLIALITKK